ncbi:MAG TPA: sigma-54-dependent Fis family transcriptional regulator [Pseudogulbenkiania sp.]|nr:sigma-54-dependent Fis family transcriptional regulator [Pseudogulbenkiania sp.]
MEGQLPQGLLRQEIEASWRRSLSHGLDCIDSKLVSLQVVNDLDMLLAANRMLLDAATPEMEFLAERYGNEGLVILGDANANMLAVEGRTDYLRTLGIQDITPGACWSESLRGTNALGTALIESRPILINSGEHYLECLSRFSCSSVPIKNPHGDAIGVLDLTREGTLAQPQDSLGMLMIAASQIESRLFGAFFPEHLVLVFHPRQQYLGSAWHGVLAVSVEGDILAANQQACDLLRLPRDKMVGQRCEEALGVRGNTLISRIVHDGTAKVPLAHGEFYFKALQLPRTPTIVSAATTVKPQLRPCTLDELADGQSRFGRALKMARQGLNNDLPVLLLGETGTGKEVVARALHEASARAGKPFIAVNCASIPEGLIESELFGYRDGAFTGARKGGVVGRLMQANGGTLFLDEIGDMPLHLQARLLRVLQERKVAPLGAGEEQNIDVAVICATHRDLKTMVRDKTFREDLYYRINGVSVGLPSLREREDISQLIDTLLSKLGAGHVTVSRELAELFSHYAWPGNIRQLEMVLRTALAMREGDETELNPEHLCDHFLEELHASTRPSGGLIRDQELELIRSTLDSHQGNVSAAAQALGISRATLYRKLKQLQW